MEVISSLNGLALQRRVVEGQFYVERFDYSFQRPLSAWK
jgi:hypothetical protein